MSLSLSTLCKSIFYLLSFLNCLLYTSNSILSLLLFYCLLYTSNSIFSILFFTVYCLLNSISTSISSPSLSLCLSFPLRLHLSLVFPHLTPSLLAQGSELNGLLFTNKHRSRKAPSQLSLPPPLRTKNSSEELFFGCFARRRRRCTVLLLCVLVLVVVGLCCCRGPMRPASLEEAKK